jgi:hypothetical protein
MVASGVNHTRKGSALEDTRVARDFVRHDRAVPRPFERSGSATIVVTLLAGSILRDGIRNTFRPGAMNKSEDRHPQSRWN